MIPKYLEQFQNLSFLLVPVMIQNLSFSLGIVVAGTALSF